MIAAILAGGKGSRMAFDTPLTPKSLSLVGGKAIIWHLVKYFDFYGFDEIWIAIGHRGNEIVEYFQNEARTHGEFDVAAPGEDAKTKGPLKPLVRLVDTGEDSTTGGRIRQLTDLINAPFLLTWCDGLADLNLRSLVEFHHGHGQPVTMTAVHPPGRFGHVTLVTDKVAAFVEKPAQTEEWINGSFFVLNPDWRRWNGDQEFDWERQCLEPMAHDGALMAYRHAGFWQCMDTSKERDLLNSMWDSGNPPWKKWD